MSMATTPKQPRPQPKPKILGAKPKPATSTTTVGPSSNTIQQAAANITAQQQKASLAWFYSMIKGQLNTRGQAKSSSRRIADDAFHVKKGMPVIGKMVFYIYDAKLKEELPFWDKFPLVIPIKYYKDGWLGLNLHYLPPQLRAKLLDKLMDYTKASKTPRAFMKLSYAMLKAAVAAPLFQPTIHRYLVTHVKTDLVEVKSEYWVKAALLPVQQFQKAGATTVWRESRKS